MKILVAAENFGFGPVSKLLSIIENTNLKQQQILFYGESESFDFLNNETEFKIEKVKSLEEKYLEDVQLIISVMDPKVLLYGKLKNIFSIFIDSLYEFWNWSSKDYKLVNQIVTDFSVIKNFKHYKNSLDELKDHQQKLLAYALCSKAFVQSAWGDLRETPFLNKIQKIKPIVDSRFCSRRESLNFNEEKIDIISLSGMNNPFIDKEKNIAYLEFISLIISKLNFLKQPIITVNPALLSEAQKIFDYRVVSLSHEEFLKLLNQSRYIFAPAGLTTVFEAKAYKTKYIPLPEYHHGHIWNWEELNKNFLTLPKTQVYQWNEFSSSKKIEDNIEALYKFYLKKEKKYYLTLDNIQKEIVKYCNSINSENDYEGSKNIYLELNELLNKV